MHLASTFELDPATEDGAYAYQRGANPTRAQLEQVLAALDGARHGFAFASGMAATDIILRAILRPGDHLARFGGDEFCILFSLNSPEEARGLAQLLVTGKREGWSPLWSSGKRSEHPPTPGLWAVEPHLGLRGVGAKFEELLVVTEDDAYWLDDDLPHVRRWQARGLLPQAREAA